MKIKFVFILLILTCISCSSLTSKPDPFSEGNKISKIRLGTLANSVEQELGKPNRKNLEKISDVEYIVWEFGSEVRPSGFITLDPKSNKVISKSIWLYKKYDLESMLKNRFKENHFKTYIPCHQSGNQTVLIDSNSGVLLATKGDTVVLASWSDPKFAQARAEQFGLKCPQLQEYKDK